MKIKICLGIVALTVLFGFAPANAIGFSINVHDQPYYTHGPSYVAGNRHYVWIPGHVNKRGSWIHGHYAVR